MNNLIDGEGISVSNVNGKVMITNTLPNRNTFKTIKILNNELVAKHPVDSLTISTDGNIKVELNNETNQIFFSLNSDEISSNIKNNLVNSENVVIRGDTKELTKEYSNVLTAYHKMLDDAVILRNEISRIKNLYGISEQVENLEKQLLEYDVNLALLSKRTSYLVGAIQDPEARFVYNPAAKSLSLNKTLTAPFVLETLTTDERNRISNPVAGRVIFNIAVKKVQVYTGQEWVDLH